MKKGFQFIPFQSIIVNREYFELLKESSFLEKLLLFEELEKFFPSFFSHQKHYRKIKGFKIDFLDIYIKKYYNHLREADSEWKNLQLLWNKGFPTSEPLFFLKKDSFVLIGTKAIPGKPCLEIIKMESQKNLEVIEKIAKFLAFFHKEKLFHQDCYLNHFYLDEDTDTLYVIDVSRVLDNPGLAFYYQIKDLAQLKFSFSVYFGEKWLILWDNFLKIYRTFLKSLSPLTQIGINLKFLKIKKHTEKLYGSKKN